MKFYHFYGSVVKIAVITFFPLMGFGQNSSAPSEELNVQFQMESAERAVIFVKGQKKENFNLRLYNHSGKVVWDFSGSAGEQGRLSVPLRPAVLETKSEKLLLLVAGNQKRRAVPLLLRNQ